MPDDRHFLKSLFDKTVESAQADKLIPGNLPSRPDGRTIVIGAGKAAAAMAAAVEKNWPGELTGLVVTPYGHAVGCEQIQVIEAAHPVPDAAGSNAAARILAAVADLTPKDLVLCLLSGGGSALLSLPAKGIALRDKQSITEQLLRSGAHIAEINCVRKHLSAIKGGRLAAASSPATVVTLAISDVPGNDVSVIASGPTVADATTSEMALDVLRRYNINSADTVTAYLADLASETPKPKDPVFDSAAYVMLATAGDALNAAAEMSRDHNTQPLMLGDLEGDASKLAADHARLARSIAAGQGPVQPPCVLISGGETTVLVRGQGTGGRNTEYALALALALDAHPGISAIACDTDGIDGTGDNAGAIVTPDTLERARQQSLDAMKLLDDNDSYNFFKRIGDLVVTGPTLTNVNDFRAILIAAQ
jgi:hydroxypyruvate reductase